MIIEKITKPKSHLECSDLTPSQKKLLYEVVASYGAVPGFSYNRFFKEGFREWELLGIERVKRDFLKTHYDEIYSPAEVDADILPSPDELVTGKGIFYRALGMKQGMKTAFADYMNELGMGRNAVLQKFTADDWAEWERIGMTTVMQEFEHAVANAKTEVATAELEAV